MNYVIFDCIFFIWLDTLFQLKKIKINKKNLVINNFLNDDDYKHDYKVKEIFLFYLFMSGLLLLLLLLLLE